MSDLAQDAQGLHAYLFDNCQTSRYTTPYMNTATETIGVRELTRNLKKVTKKVQKGASIVVQKNSTPLFRIVPFDTNNAPQHITLADIENIQFKGKKHSSRDIDAIVYGV